MAAEIPMPQPEPASLFPPVRGGWPRKYDFAEWADGEAHVLQRFYDYDASTARFYKAAWSWAERHGYRLTFRTLSSRRCSVQFKAL